MAEHRVVSMLPAAAEALHLIGGGHLLVGRGHSDDYPAEVSSLPIVTAARIEFTSSKGNAAIVNIVCFVLCQCVFAQRFRSRVDDPPDSSYHHP